MSNATDFADGSAYERMMGRWSRLVGRQFLDWCATPPGLEWADVGCGNGAFTEEIDRQAAPRSIIGVDPAPAQLDFARSRKTAASTSYLLGDAQDLPLMDGSVDVATMGLVIAFVPNPERALSEMVRVTRPGGRIHAYMWDLVEHLSPLAPLQQALRDMGVPAGSPISAQVSTEDQLRGLWTTAGLHQVETTRLSITVAFDDFDDFWTSITTPLGPQADRLRSLDDAARQDLRTRLQKAVPVSADGSVRYEAVANAVRGQVR